MSKKPMRLPNGFGCVTLLQGNRRKPYQAKTPITGYRKNGNPIQRSLGCYETYNAAYQALMDYHRQSDPQLADKLTFAEVYERAIAEMKASGNTRAEKTYKTYQSRFNALSILHSRPIAEIRLQELQDAVDGTSKGHSSRGITTTVCKLIYDYAHKHDLCEKNYAEYLNNNGDAAVVDPEKFFHDDEMTILKSLADIDETARRLVVMCYTGFRYSAYLDWQIDLDEMVVRGGVKQRANKEYKPRTVPIHPQIVKYIKGITFPSAIKFNKEMKEFEERHGIRPLTAHATRHTMSYMLDKAKTDPITARMILGHSLGSDVHDTVYAHRSIEQLRDAIEALPY